MPPNFQIRPLKLTEFSDCVSKGSQKRPYVSACKQNFQKPTYIFTFVSGLEDKPMKVHSLNRPQATSDGHIGGARAWLFQFHP